MRRSVRAGLPVAVAGALLTAGAPHAAATERVTTVESIGMTQTEVMCGGEEVPVTYDGVQWTTQWVGRSGEPSSWFRFRAQLTWTQGDVDYTAWATGGFWAGERASNYSFLAGGAGDDGSTVRIVEVVHAKRTGDGEQEVLFEVERVICR